MNLSGLKGLVLIGLVALGWVGAAVPAEASYGYAHFGYGRSRYHGRPLPYYRSHGFRHHYYHHGYRYYPRNAVIVSGRIGVGTIVVALPIGYQPVVVDGYTYYECDGVYYAPYHGKYRVVRSPYHRHHHKRSGVSIKVRL